MMIQEKNVFSTTTACDISFVFFSSPDLVSGNSYKLISAGTQLGEAAALTGNSPGNEVPTPPENNEESNKNNSENSVSDSEAPSSGTSSSIDETVVENNGTESVESTTSSEQTTSNSLPKTSDTENILQSVVILSVSTILLSLIVVFKKRKKD